MKKNFVGVVAEKPWQAIQVASRLKVSWSPGTGLSSHGDYYGHLRSQQPRRDTIVVDSGDVDVKMAAAVHVVKATYYYPYQMHGSVGSSCAVADVQGGDITDGITGGITIWAASQSVHALRSSTALVLGVDPANVRVVFVRGSGSAGL